MMTNRVSMSRYVRFVTISVSYSVSILMRTCTRSGEGGDFITSVINFKGDTEIITTSKLLMQYLSIRQKFDGRKIER